jgi:hypothetical protein
VCRGNSTVGSNPTLSAILLRSLNRARASAGWLRRHDEIPPEPWRRRTNPTLSANLRQALASLALRLAGRVRRAHAKVVRRSPKGEGGHPPVAEIVSPPSAFARARQAAWCTHAIENAGSVGRVARMRCGLLPPRRHRSIRRSRRATHHFRLTVGTSVAGATHTVAPARGVVLES